MPFKVSKIATGISQQSISPVATSIDTSSNDVGSKQDSDLVTVKVESASSTASASTASKAGAFTSSVSGTSKPGSSKPVITQSKTQMTASSSAISQAVSSAKSDLRSGVALTPSRAKTSAQESIKSAKVSNNFGLAPDFASVVTQKSKSSTFATLAGAFSAGSMVSSPTRLSTRGASSSRQRTASPYSSWITPGRPTGLTPVVNLNVEDQVYEYGLYLLRPEIITLYDSDPLYQTGTSTNADNFLSMQFAYAKSMQEASYRRTRSLMSSLSYLPSLGFNESDLQPLDTVTTGERLGTTLFEQAVSKWDADYNTVLSFETQVADRAIAAQNVASALDISNMSSNATSDSYAFVTLKTLVDQAVQEINTTPTAAQRQSNRLVAGLMLEGSLDLHNYLRNTADGSSFLSSLINTDTEIDVGFRSYTLMHTLLQQAFFSFAFGSSRDSTVSELLTRTRDESDPQSAYKYTLSDSPLAKFASRETFTTADTYAENAYELSTAVSSEDIAKAVLLRLVSLASYKGSGVYNTTSTALEAFNKYLGLPVGISSGVQGTGNPISDFEIAGADTSAGLLFQFSDVVNTSQKLVFFDRSHNPGLPSGYTHGYTRIFGNTQQPAQTASVLANRMTSAIDKNTSIDKKLLSSNITLNGTTYKASDLSRLLLQKFSSLLVSNWDSEGFSRQYASETKTILQDTYLKYVNVAGNNQTTFLRTENLDLHYSLEPQNLFTGGFSTASIDVKLVPTYADHEILKLLSMNLPYTGALLEWSKSAVQTLMTYWSQKFDFEVGITDSVPSPITRSIYGTSIIDQVFTVDSLEYYYGTETYLSKLDVYASQSIDRLVAWSISTAYALFGSEGSSVRRRSSTSTSLPKYSSLFPATNGSTSYEFKEICLLLVMFASHHMQSIFDRVKSSGFDLYSPFVKFKDEATQIVDDLVSHVPISYDDARLCLGILNAQMQAATPGLLRIANGEGDLLTNGKFNLIYTPCQASAMTMRKYEFLYRRKKAPFHCPRYDEVSSVRALERSAIRSLYRTDLMAMQDTRVMFVGLPAGIQHVIGLGQRYAKITITRRDQTSLSTQYNTISFIFDMFTFMSPNASDAIGNTPWKSSAEGVITEVRDINFFRMGASGGSGLSNLQNHTTAYVDLTYAPRTVVAGTESASPFTSTFSGRMSAPTVLGSGTSTSSTSGYGDFTREAYTSSTSSGIPSSTALIETGEVKVSDFIADVEFIDENAAASDLGTTVDQLLNNPTVIGNHLVDHLLKVHARNISGLDLDESTFTTSAAAFNPGAAENLDDARAYLLHICSVDFLDSQADSTNLESGVKHLDILSKTPLIRSNEYAELCISPTYFDRVFAFPINIAQFIEISTET